jgi:hypothetical protein
MNGMQASFRFLHSLGNGPIVIVPLPSFRWEIKQNSCVEPSENAFFSVQFTLLAVEWIQ